MSNQNLKPLSEIIEQRIRNEAARAVEAAILAAHETARTAYRDAMSEVCGADFAFTADNILADAEIAIAEAAQRCAERKAMNAFVDRMASEAGEA